MISLSIIIPIYNGARHLPQLFRVLEMQNIFFKDDKFWWEVIFVDDGSQDESSQILSSFANEHSDIIRYIRQDNLGLGEARNTGIHAACGEYVYMMDCDDVLVPSTLKEFTIRLANSQLNVLYFNYEIIKYENRESFILNSKTPSDANFNIFTTDDFLKLNDGLKRGAPVWSSILKREYVIKNNLFFFKDIRLWEDFAFTFNLLAVTERILYTPFKAYGYIFYPDSLSNNFTLSYFQRNLSSFIPLFSILESLSKKRDSYFKDCVMHFYGSVLFTLWRNFIRVSEHNLSDALKLSQWLKQNNIIPIERPLPTNLMGYGISDLFFRLLLKAQEHPWMIKPTLAMYYGLKKLLRR